MENTVERPFRTLWIGVGLLIMILGLAFFMARPQPVQLPVLGQVADFALTNQFGQPVTLDALRGEVWLADIIFTRCPGPCARMTRQMSEVQVALPKNSRAKLVSLTTDPEFDTPEILARYAARFGADTNRWQFLTGTKLAIAELAIDSLKLVALDKPAAERTSADDLFIHSTMFVLIDKQGRLRGMVDEHGAVRAGFETGGEGVEWAKVQVAIQSAIKQLERER